jgi:hypothetical protein
MFRRLGILPDSLQKELASEQVVLLEQHLKATITWRNFRAPHRRDGIRKDWTRGSLAITRSRVLVWAQRMRQVDVTYDSPLFDALELATEPGRLVIGFDVHRFHDDWSGRMEVRLRHPEPDRLLDTIRSTRRLA